MKVVACLGNPGAEYSTTRHNVGWWLADRLTDRWGLGRFRRDGAAAVAAGSHEGVEVMLVKPLAYMNRSGRALAQIQRASAFDVSTDLLVVVDDVALDPGHARFRPGGSAGGHNGLKSVEAELGTRDYARLRIGVGAKPPGVDLADWVLSAPAHEDRQQILDVLPGLADGVAIWMHEGIEPAMNHSNG